MATDPQPPNATEALERLDRLSLRQLSMVDLLRTVAEPTTTVLRGAPETSVTLLVRGEATTVASTGQLTVDLDETQYEHGHGPCLHAPRTGELTLSTDTRTDDRWPDYLARAVGRGRLTSLSVPLVVDEEEQISGALNVYARQPDAFDEASRAVAARFAPYAAVPAGNLHAYQSARGTAEHLRAELESRAVIDQAKGARASMDTNHKVLDIADHLVHTGELLGAPPEAPAHP